MSCRDCERLQVVVLALLMELMDRGELNTYVVSRFIDALGGRTEARASEIAVNLYDLRDNYRTPSERMDYVTGSRDTAEVKARAMELLAALAPAPDATVP